MMSTSQPSGAAKSPVIVAPPDAGVKMSRVVTPGTYPNGAKLFTLVATVAVTLDTPTDPGGPVGPVGPNPVGPVGPMNGITDPVGPEGPVVPNTDTCGETVTDPVNNRVALPDESVSNKSYTAFQNVNVMVAAGGILSAMVPATPPKIKSLVQS